ncbi:MAG TPA: hypothetical protein VKA74_09500, partial [Myxococcota bacterium]|nr:hypothetical protein [Myxococcota bacterium]
MASLRSQPVRDPRPLPRRRHAPLNSVSTRIILCVFGSTLLTALIVSWLSVGAIHRDVRDRLGRSTGRLVVERAEAIRAWHAEATKQLAAAAVRGTAWHAALTEALERSRGTGQGSLNWVAGDRPTGAPARPLNGALALPAPPPDLVQHLERLTLRPVSIAEREATHSTPNRLGCLSARVDLLDSPGRRVGTLEGCLDNPTLFELLQPPTGSLRGFRMLLVDAEGRVAAASGLRAEARLGETL